MEQYKVSCGSVRGLKMYKGIGLDCAWVRASGGSLGGNCLEQIGSCTVSLAFSSGGEYWERGGTARTWDSRKRIEYILKKRKREAHPC